MCSKSSRKLPQNTKPHNHKPHLGFVKAVNSFSAVPPFCAFPSILSKYGVAPNGEKEQKDLLPNSHPFDSLQPVVNLHLEPGIYGGVIY